MSIAYLILSLLVELMTLVDVLYRWVRHDQ